MIRNIDSGVDIRTVLALSLPLCRSGQESVLVAQSGKTDLFLNKLVQFRNRNEHSLLLRDNL